MADKTAGAKQFVRKIIFEFSAPYGEDITLEVFKEVEVQPSLMREYRELEAGLTHDVVNNWMGFTPRKYGFEDAQADRFGRM